MPILVSPTELVIWAEESEMANRIVLPAATTIPLPHHLPNLPKQPGSNKPSIEIADNASVPDSFREVF